MLHVLVPLDGRPAASMRVLPDTAHFKVRLTPSYIVRDAAAEVLQNDDQIRFLDLDKLLSVAVDTDSPASKFLHDIFKIRAFSLSAGTDEILRLEHPGAGMMEESQYILGRCLVRTISKDVEVVTTSPGIINAYGSAVHAGQAPHDGILVHLSDGNTHKMDGEGVMAEGWPYGLMY